MADTSQQIFYGGNPQNPSFYQLGSNGLYQQIDGNSTPLGNLNAIGQQAIQNGQVTQIPNGGVTIPIGAETTSQVGGTPTTSTGIASTLGVSTPQIPSAPAPTDNSAQYNSMISGLTTANQGTISALEEQQVAAQQQLQQSQQGETAGYAQTAAMLQGIGGISGQWQNFFGSLNEQHQTTMDALNAQYNSAIATANGALATQIATIQQNEITNNQQQQQQFFQNAMSVFNAQTSLINSQITQSQSQQQLQMQQQNQTFQQQQAQYTQNTNQLNTILTSLAGNKNNTWSNLSPQAQQNLNSLATSLNMSPATLQSMVNANAIEATNTTSYTDPITGATTLLSTNKAGQIVSQQVINPGYAAGSPQLINNVMTSYAQQTPSGQKWAVNSGLPNYAKTILVNQGVKMLPASQGTQMYGIQDASNLVEQALQTISSSQLAAKNSGELVSDYLNNSVEQAMQTYDPGNGQTFSSMEDMINTSIISSIRNVIGVQGGMGLNAIFSNIGGFTMDNHTTVQQLQSELTNLQNQLESGQNVLLGLPSDTNTNLNIPTNLLPPSAGSTASL